MEDFGHDVVVVFLNLKEEERKVVLAEKWRRLVLTV